MFNLNIPFMCKLPTLNKTHPAAYLSLQHRGG